MNEDTQRKPVDSCSGNFVDNMGGSSVSNSNVSSPGTHLEKRTLPFLYVQSPLSKNLNTSELQSTTFGLPKVISTPVTSVSNGVNGGKTIQAFVGTLINNKCQQKVLLTPVKAGQEKQGVTRLLVQGQRSGGLARIAPAKTTQSGGGTNSSALSVVLPSSHSNKQICTSYVVNSGSNTSTSTVNSNINSSPIITGTRPISIRNAVLIDSANNNSQNKTAQPNIIRQKIGPDGKITVSSLLKPSGLGGTSLLSKVLASPTAHQKLPIVQIKTDNNKKGIEKRNSNLSDDIVLIEDDDEDESIDKTSNNALIKESSTPKLNMRVVSTNGIKESTKISSQDIEITKVASPMLDRARKRKGLIAICEPPSKVTRQQDKLKLLPGAEDFDPFKIVEWGPSGTGLLPGSNIKMTINELGMLTVAEDTLTERGAAPAITISDEDEGKNANKKGNELDSILCCVCCSCYGLPAEFYNASYCSISCRDTVTAQEEAIVKKIEQEQEQNSDNEQKKKRNKPLDTIKKCTPSPTETATVSVNSSNDDDNKGPKDALKTPIVLTESDDNNEEEKSIPGYMVGVLKQHSSNENEYNAAILKAKKIVRKGKILNSGLRFKNVPKLNKPESPVITNGVAQNIEKPQSLIKTLKATEISPKSLVQPNIEISKTIKTNKLDFSRLKSTVTVKCKQPISQEISQDLDCGTLTPNRSEKEQDTSEVDQFQWATYLAETGSRPAWIKLFNNPFPVGVNLFQVGYKMEAIDPEHQSHFCVVTVTKVKGYRLKLHFDCYSEKYDFWTNVDSPNIFPCGFCARHNIPLNPPQGHSRDTFNWLSYNTIWMSTAASTRCFPNYTTNITQPNLFQVGMKLEAVDRKNTFLVCVATVAGVIENRILVHFDSWGDVYDYWVDTSSPYIRPVGWCQENNHELTPPNGIKPTEFSWSEYLENTKSEAAPTRAFTLRPHYEFRKGMKLEAIDKRAPHLLRVATVREVLPYQIKIVFDGFPEQFGYWVDDDCPDIHPVGWGSRTGHHLESPPNVNTTTSQCPTPGCLGQGHFRTNALETHTTAHDCPYSIDHLKSEPRIPDRLTSSRDNIILSRQLEGEVIYLDNDDSGDESDDIKSKRWKWLGIREGINKTCGDTKIATDNNKKVSITKKVRRRKKRRRVIKLNTDNKEKNENVCKIQNWEDCEILKNESDPLKWSIQEVVEFANHVCANSDCVGRLENEEVNGKGLLMMTVEDLVYYLGFTDEIAKLLHDKINILRSKVT